VLSLSAIPLNDDYYAALQSAKRDLDGVTIANEPLVIPFKAHAFLSLCDEGKAEKQDTRKHRNDVFRLLQLLPGDATIDVSEPIRLDLRRFVDVVEKDKALDPQSFKVPMSREDGVALLRSA
jgi:hypothetical protein